MKKALFGLLAIAGIAIFCSFTKTSVTTVNVDESSNQEILLAYGSTYTVSCIRFTNVGTARTRGVYDSDDNTITIHGETYRVRVNPYRGDGTKRGDYYYMAGEWFFNL